MPVRLNPNRPKRFRARYRIRNWPQYEAGLKRRGDLTLWLEEAAIAGWHASRRTTPGGQALYSDLAIELVLTLRLVFHLALRQGMENLRRGAHHHRPAARFKENCLCAGMRLRPSPDQSADGGNSDQALGH